MCNCGLSQERDDKEEEGGKKSLVSREGESEKEFSFPREDKFTVLREYLILS